MNDPNITELAVVDEDGKFLGDLTKRLVLQALSGMYGYTLNARKFQRTETVLWKNFRWQHYPPQPLPTGRANMIPSVISHLSSQRRKNRQSIRTETVWSSSDYAVLREKGSQNDSFLHFIRDY